MTVSFATMSTPSGVSRAMTPLYASPQQREGIDPPRPADDVHALGVIWYQLLFGNTNLALGIDFAYDLRGEEYRDESVTVVSRRVASRVE